MNNETLIAAMTINTEINSLEYTIERFQSVEGKLLKPSRSQTLTFLDTETGTRERELNLLPQYNIPSTNELNEELRELINEELQRCLDTITRKMEKMKIKRQKAFEKL